MSASEDVHERVAKALADVDQRYTGSRRALVDAMGMTDGPLGVTALLARVPGVPQSSVYRNLAVLENAGVVTRVSGTEGFGCYELVEDLVGHHHHLLCTSCGKVVDVTLPAAVERSVEKAVAGVAAEAGFEAHQHRLDLLGRCGECT